MKQPTESQIQQAFFDYVNIRKQESGNSPWHLIVATPNALGGHANPQVRRSQMIRGSIMKKEGASNGFPDISILVPIKPYPAYFIELKRMYGKLSDYQAEWLSRLELAGFKAEVIKTDDPEVLISAVRKYLGEI